MTDPGPAPRITAGRLLVYVAHRLDQIEDKLDDHHKGAVGWRYRTVQQSRRSDLINITIAVLQGMLLTANYIGGIIAGSYVLIFHSWYMQRIVGWLHGVF